MTLGAVQDMNLIEKLGAQMGEQSKRLGLQFNFAPVLDINTNPPYYRFPFFWKTSIKLRASNSVNERYAGRVFPQETFSWSRGYRHRLPKLPTVSFSKQN
jgi:hypothetical protein